MLLALGRGKVPFKGIIIRNRKVKLLDTGSGDIIRGDMFYCRKIWSCENLKFVHGRMYYKRIDKAFICRERDLGYSPVRHSLYYKGYLYKLDGFNLTAFDLCGSRMYITVYSMQLGSDYTLSIKLTPDTDYLGIECLGECTMGEFSRGSFCYDDSFR